MLQQVSNRTQIYQVLRTAPLWDGRALLTSPVSIWLFPISTDNSSRRSPRAFARPPSAACINRDLSALQTLCPAAQSNSISSHHATSLSLRHPYKEASAGIFKKKNSTTPAEQKQVVSQQIPHEPHVSTRMLCPQLPPGNYAAKLGHVEPVRLLWHLATSLNKSLSPTSISLEGSRVPLGHRQEVEEALPQVCAVPKHIPMYPRADPKMAPNANDLASLVAGTSPHVLPLHHTQERGWPELVIYACLPETPWLLFYSAMRNAKTFATDMANIPLVQLKVLNPVSLQEKTDLEYKLTQIYRGSKQELPS